MTPFRNAPVKIADTPADFEDKNFLRENETVSQFLQRVGTNPNAIARGLQDAQMKSLCEAPIGIYSRYVFHPSNPFTPGAHGLEGVVWDIWNGEYHHMLSLATENRTSPRFQTMVFVLHPFLL